MNRSSKLQTVNNGSGNGVAESDAGLPQSHEERIVKKFDAGVVTHLGAQTVDEKRGANFRSAGY